MRSFQLFKKIFRLTINHLIKWCFLLYRLIFAEPIRVLGGGCRFSPSCSQFSEQAIGEFGLLRGGLASCWRILRCHPFHPGGMEPVPEEFLGRRRKKKP